MRVCVCALNTVPKDEFLEMTAVQSLMASTCFPAATVISWILHAVFKITQVSCTCSGRCMICFLGFQAWCESMATWSGWASERVCVREKEKQKRGREKYDKMRLHLWFGRFVEDSTPT